VPVKILSIILILYVKLLDSITYSSLLDFQIKLVRLSEKIMIIYQTY